MKTSRLIGKVVVLLSAILLLACLTWAQEPTAQAAPDWSHRTFSAAPGEIFAAALKSIGAQHHEVKSKDEVNNVISFHVGTTAWSWGYNMVLKIAPGENSASTVSIEIARSGGKAVSWGSGKKEVQKIFDGMEKELAKAPPAATK